MYKENIGYCRSCGARIRFIRMKSGKAMPVNELFVNYKRKPSGKERIVTPDGDIVVCEICMDSREADGFGYISHFATCPHAGKHRKSA